MIIYSTKIHVKDSFNTITFIELAIQWNQSSCYDAIPNLSWDGSNSYTAEYNHRKFCIQILEEDHIVAIHFEREEQNDVLWSHDFILHDKEEPYPTISIQILRETRSNLPFVPDGKPPRFVRMLLDAGYGAMDYDLPISNQAIPITFSNYFINLLYKLFSSLQNSCTIFHKLHIPYFQSIYKIVLVVYFF